MSAFDIDTLRNELLACRKQCMAYDQARIDADIAARNAKSSEIEAQSIAQKEREQRKKHRCPPDLRAEVDTLKNQIREHRCPPTLKHEVERLKSEISAHRCPPTFKAEVDRLKAEIANHKCPPDLSGMVSDLKNKSSELEADNKKLKQSLTTERNDHSANIKKANLESQYLARKLSTQSLKIESMTKENDQLKSRVEKLQSYIENQPNPESPNQFLAMRVKQLEDERRVRN